MRTLAVLTIPGALVFAIAVAAVRLVGDAPPPAAVHRAAAVVWAGRVFASRTDLARWLRSRGASYTVWSERHPSPPVTPTQSTEAASAPAAAGPSRREAPAQGSGDSLWERSRLLAAGLIAAGLGVVALLYRRLRRHDFRLPSFPRRGPGQGVPRRPAINVGGLLDAVQSSFRGAWRATHSQLERRRAVVQRPGLARRVPRLPAVNMEGFLDAIDPARRGVQRTTHFVLHRRSEVAWVVATSGLAIAVAVLLPHL